MKGKAHYNFGSTATEYAPWLQGSSLITTSAAARLQVTGTLASGQERLARFTVADASSDRIEILNRSATNSTFAPMIQTVSISDPGQPALTIDAQIDTTGDTGTEPMMEFSVRRNNNTDVGTRPLFEWNNRTSSQMLMDASGNLGIGTSTPTYLLDVNGGDINLSTGQVLRINGKIVLAHDALILKAPDADACFRITVDSLGQLKATAL